MSSSSPLVFSNVCFGYGTRPVIDSLSLEVKAGEVLAIMGGSGVGKTTLLRLMTGLVASSSGSGPSSSSTPSVATLKPKQGAEALALAPTDGQPETVRARRRARASHI